MANEEHVRMIRQGAIMWNRWRRANSQFKPDLSEADLSGLDLTQALLAQADLSRSVLRGSQMRGADLRAANLRETDLFLSSLHSAILYNACLVKANLCGAMLVGTNVLGADFEQARIGWTIFADVDLRNAKGLETVMHNGPSTLGIDTIYRSKGKIPEAFLRGVGVSEELIAHAHSILSKPIEFNSCFISYSSKDQSFATRLHFDLQSQGVRCWFAPEDMKIGDPFRVRIDESIRIHDKLLLVLSENSVASPQVEQEVETALERERRHGKTVLFPIRVDDAVMEIETGWPALIRNTRHIGDFTRWKDHDAYQAAFERLLRDLKAEGG